MKIANRLFVLLTLLLFPNIFAWAQGPTAIRAKIIDSKTRMPVPFATVKIMKGKEFRWGVISNGEGDFQIPFQYRPIIDSIVITCIGYENQVLKMNQLLDDKVNIINLKAASVKLQEVVVSARRKGRLAANKIVRLAIQNIPNNYPIHPFSYVAYYRDYQREENEYVNLNEAIVGIFDEGFDANDFLSTKIKLYQYRTNKDFRRDSTTAITYDNNNFGGNKFIPTATVFSFGGNELSILRVHDAIRNNSAISYSFVNEFKSDFVKHHSFKLLETVSLDDAPLYHISFQSLYFITGAEHFAKGEIFIEHGNYAIHKLIYSTYLKELDNEKLLYKIQVEYARADSLMFLNYISFNNLFKSNTNEGFRVDNVVYDRAMNAFIVTFNRTPQRMTALDKRNYDFKFDKKPFNISEIEASVSNDKEVRVFVENAHDFNLFEKPDVLAKKFEAIFKNIKDIQGNEVNEVKYKLVNQFRELFLQKLEQSSEEPNVGSFISKETPMKQNRIDSVHVNSSNYWMNTPLKKN